jgi:hypothetical protein
MWSCSLCNFLPNDWNRTYKPHTCHKYFTYIYLAFQRCFRPTRPFLESIIKGRMQAQFLTNFYLCSPEICSFLTTRIHKTHRILAISLFLKSTSWRALRKIICSPLLLLTKSKKARVRRNHCSNGWLLDICQCLHIKLPEALWLYLRDRDNYLRTKKLIYPNFLSVVISRIEKEDSWMRPVTML